MSFAEAEPVFFTRSARIQDDPDHSIGETREIIIGPSAMGRLLIISFVETEDHIRISTPAGPPRMSEKTTKKASERRTSGLRREYRFDYSKAKPNRFAAEIKEGSLAVVLEPDVAAVFDGSESVNRLLRSVIAAMPKKKRSA